MTSHIIKYHSFKTKRHFKFNKIQHIYNFKIYMKSQFLKSHIIKYHNILQYHNKEFIF